MSFNSVGKSVEQCRIEDPTTIKATATERYDYPGAVFYSHCCMDEPSHYRDVEEVA